MPVAFSSLGLSAGLLEVLDELGFATATEIQEQAIPLLLAGRDLIGQSKTGSGKTAAFALPILDNLDLDQSSIQALVLCPTRELCAQVTRDMRTLGRRHPGLKVLSVSGGAPMRPQVGALERGVHVVVGTPGRVLHHLRQGTLELGKVATLVLDEADRMLDMGFEDDMQQILAALPRARQSAFFSATFPPAFEALSEAHQDAAVRVSVEDPANEHSPEIRQQVRRAEREDKLGVLFGILGDHQPESTLIFCNFKASVAELFDELARAGVSVDCLHGDLDQFERTQVMAMFRNGSVRVLVATDVLARGIDVPDLELVINYELPTQAEVYLHRIGRTGRAGKTGLAIALAGAKDQRKLGAIEALTGTRLEPVEPGASAREDWTLPTKPHMATIKISGGRKHKIRPTDILGALTGEAGGLAGADVGKIEIHDRLTYVAISRPLGEAAARALDQGRIKGRRFRARLVKPSCEW